jgi:hypothetical protein
MNDDEKNRILEEMELLVKSISQLKTQIQELVDKNSDLLKRIYCLEEEKLFLK